MSFKENIKDFREVHGNESGQSMGKIEECYHRKCFDEGITHCVVSKK